MKITNSQYFEFTISIARRITQRSTRPNIRRSVRFIMRKNATGNVWIHYSISIIAYLSTIFWAHSKTNGFRYGYHKHCEVYPQEHCHDVPVQHPVKVNRNLFKSCAFTKTFRCHMKTAMTCQTLTAIKFLYRWNRFRFFSNKWTQCSSNIWRCPKRSAGRSQRRSA